MIRSATGLEADAEGHVSARVGQQSAAAEAPVAAAQGAGDALCIRSLSMINTNAHETHLDSFFLLS
jgi:hypothetical protein